MRQTIVIADDDRETTAALSEHLHGEAFETVVVETARDARREIERSAPVLVILGTNLVDAPGLDLARWVLAQPSSPGLILLSSRADPIDRTIGLEMGADDYMSKPLFVRELLARVHSVLRRLQRWSDDGGHPPRAEVVVAWGYSINLLSRQVILPHGPAATLSWTEAKVLSVLLEHRGVPVTRDVLSQRALGRAWSPEERALDQHVASLRRKLQSPPPARPLIATVRHVGYVIESER